MMEKLTHIHKWLEDLFGREKIPEYEINSQTLEILYAMAEQSMKKDSMAKTATEDTEQKIEEYKSETKRLKLVSEWLGISNPAPVTKAYMESLSSTALAVGLKDCSDTSLCQSLSELCCQRARNKVARREIKKEEESLEENLRRVIIKQANQNRALAEVSKGLKTKQVSTANKLKEMDFLKQKTSQYNKLVSSLKSELDQIGYKPDYIHSSLQEISKEIQDLQSQLVPLKAQLVSYQDLPPDIDLAKIKLYEKRRNLARLEEEFSKSVDLVHTGKLNH